MPLAHAGPDTKLFTAVKHHHVGTGCEGQTRHPEANFARRCRVADRALDTLDGAFEATLQYLEEVLSPGGPGDGPLALAALRALARWTPRRRHSVQQYIRRRRHSVQQ